jgi:hypothetical protein
MCALRDSIVFPIARRRLTFEIAGEAREVTMILGEPRRISETGDWSCPYQLLGIGRTNVRYAEGVDSAQALYLALEGISSELNDLSARLVWNGLEGPDLPTRRDRVRLGLAAPPGHGARNDVNEHAAATSREEEE